MPPKGTIPAHGARPLKRVIQQRIQTHWPRLFSRERSGPSMACKSTTTETTLSFVHSKRPSLQSKTCNVVRQEVPVLL
ncbi:MAG: hypothetical protein U0894_10140 [Pirellulales bacterium]